MSTLIPADPDRCQTEITEYRPFIMGGDVNQTRRCSNAPTWIATEKKPGKDGQRGSMSLCDDCREQLVKQFTKAGKALPEFKPVNAGAR